MIYNVPSGSYEIMISAVSKAGIGTAAVVIRTFTNSFDGIESNTTAKLAAGLGVLLTAVAILILIVVLKRRHTRKFGTQINSFYSKELLKIDADMKNSSNQICKKVTDEWEIPAENITFEEVLGEGAFGLVKKGVLKKLDGRYIEVGVKMLKRTNLL